MKRIFSRRGAVTTAFVFGALILGIALATWTATGSGDGRAKARTASASVVTARTGAADLYPGFADGDVYFTVTNPNPYAVRFTSATFGTVTSSAPLLCPATNVTVDASASGLAIDVPANSAGTDSSIADVVAMASTAPDDCQGVDFTIQVTLSGGQV